jgi:hypothetical protein
MNKQFDNINRETRYNKDQYSGQGQKVDIDGIKRILAIIVAFVLWALSMKFSVAGFGDGVNKNDVWIGWVLAFVITAIELIWNGMKDKTNLTLWVAGMFSYAYGIYTNVVGILYWQGYTFDNAWANLALWIFPLTIGIFLEIVAEPLFVWGVTGNHDGGDFLGNLFGNKLIPSPNKTQQYRPQPKPVQVKTNQQKQKYDAKHKPQHNIPDNGRLSTFKNIDQQYRQQINNRGQYDYEHSGDDPFPDVN